MSSDQSWCCRTTMAARGTPFPHASKPCTQQRGQGAYHEPDSLCRCCMIIVLCHTIVLVYRLTWDANPLACSHNNTCRQSNYETSAYFHAIRSMLQDAQRVLLPITADSFAGKEAAAEALPSNSTSTEQQQQQQQQQSSAPRPTPSGISAGQGLRLAGLGLAFAGLAAGIYFGGKRLLASSLGDKGKQACPLTSCLSKATYICNGYDRRLQCF